MVVHLDDFGDIPFSENGRPRPHSWQPESLIRLAANPPEPPTIGSLLYPGKRTILSGETESMKTWLALILCKSELEEGFPVGWVDLDAMGPGALLERLQLLGCPDEQIDNGFLYYQPADMLDPAKLAELEQTIAGRRIRLFVIDAFNPILSLHGLEPNSTPDIETFWRTIADPICRAGAAPCLLDHVVKNSENRGKYAYGSERKASGAIVHIGFRPLEPLTKGGRGRTLLTVHKDRPGYLPRPTIGRLVLTSDDDHITYTIEPDRSHDTDRFRPTILMERISRQLELQSAAVAKSWVEENVQGKAEAKREALEVLVDEGFVKRETGARKALLFTSLKPYREEGDDTSATSSPPRPHLVPDLRSRSSSSSSPPLKGTRSIEDPWDDLVPPRPRPGSEADERIYEYARPPLDESLAPELDDEPGYSR
jgi:hypothetical protein